MGVPGRVKAREDSHFIFFFFFPGACRPDGLPQVTNLRCRQGATCERLRADLRATYFGGGAIGGGGERGPRCTKKNLVVVGAGRLKDSDSQDADPKSKKTFHMGS